MNSDLAVEVRGLTKTFGGTEALCGVDLEVRAGTVFGLLGPNGAGKTTLVRILATLLRPDAGTAVVAGHDVVRAPNAVRSRIGLTGQFAAVDEKLTGRENLRMFARLYHLPAFSVRQKTEQLLSDFDLSDASDRVVKTYSGGMRRRLDIAASLLIEPAVLFLDEPTTGLDPRSRNEVWEAIRGLVASGTTVLLTTQYLDEADQLADRIAVIDQGSLIAQGTSSELKSKVGGARLEVIVEEPSAFDSAVAALARAVGGAPDVARSAHRISIDIDGGGSQALVAAARELDIAGVTPDDIGIRRPTLDDVFMRITGHAASSDPEAQKGAA